MSRKSGRIAVTALGGVACAGLLALAAHWSGWTRPLNAQTFSPRCQTPTGECYIPAQEVGTSCFCPTTQQWGTIVP